MKIPIPEKVSVEIQRRLPGPANSKRRHSVRRRFMRRGPASAYGWTLLAKLEEK